MCKNYDKKNARRWITAKLIKIKKNNLNNNNYLQNFNLDINK